MKIIVEIQIKHDAIILEEKSWFNNYIFFFLRFSNKWSIKFFFQMKMLN